MQTLLPNFKADPWTNVAPSRWVRRALLAASMAMSSCGLFGETTTPPAIPGAISSHADPSARISFHALAQKPRLSVIYREGDPAPALAVVFATGLGSLPTAALSAVVESRLTSAGFSPRVRAYRSAFRVEWFVEDASRVGTFFAAISRAMRDPITASGPDMALVAKRVEAVQKAPLDAPELDPVAACTGQLGVVPGQPPVDTSSGAFVTQLDAQRREALHAGRMAIAAAGPTDFGSLVFQELSRSEGWPAGSPAVDTLPTADSVSTYVVPPGGHAGRVVVAVRVNDGISAVTVAERLAAPGSALRGRLAALPHPFLPLEIAGFARPHGGCISITLESEARLSATKLERAAAYAAAIAKHEIAIESAVKANHSLVSRQILAAPDPRDVASRAAWWALSSPIPRLTPRATVVLGLPPSATPSAEGSSGRTFVQEHERAMASVGSPAADRRVAVERGQGELWVLVASPCGVGDEGAADAGITALSLLSAVAAHGMTSGVTLEPWIGADGAGLFAHAPPRDDRETPPELARRVGNAVMRALSPATLTTSSIVEARTSMLTHLERSTGRGGIAFEALAEALAPEHPSWFEPFGTFTRVSAATLEVSRLRLRSLLETPLRVAVLANMDVPQASEVGFSIDRWLSPRDASRSCSAATLGAQGVRPSKLRLPRDAGLGQALVAAPVPAVGATGHDAAMFTALVLGGEGGLLEKTFPPASGVRATVRLTGTARAAALVVDLRAPSDLLDGAVMGLMALLSTLATSGVSPADMQRATDLAMRHASETRFDPRKRLVALWSGRPLAPTPPPSAQAMQIFIASTLNESSLVVIEAQPDR
ncbi:MAG: hypothetical protein IPM54_27460 [Polyangiaceae bacterium]|nr:hypothetical protein [Polyangiaceae bacterium]